MNTTLLAPDNLEPLIDPDKDYYEELVGEGKKFSSPQELAKSKIHADLYIKSVTDRMDEMRAENLRLKEEDNAKAKLQELIDRMSATQKTDLHDNNHSVDDTKSNVSFDPKEIESLVSSKIQEFEASKKQEANFNLVRAKLKEQFGDSYQAVLKSQIDELGLTAEFVDDLARKHPTVLLKTLGLTDKQQQQTFTAPPRSDRRSDNFQPNVQKRTWTYYQNMKRKDPNLFNDKKTIVQMHKDAVELGAAFQDGDFHAYD